MKPVAEKEKAEDLWPEFADEIRESLKTTSTDKVTSEAPPKPKPCRKKPEGWWKEKPYSEWVSDRGREPTAYELFLDYITGRVLKHPKVMNIISSTPSRLYHYKIHHPERGLEEVTLHTNPTETREGPPDDEPDLVSEMDYYTFLCIVSGHVPMMSLLYEGHIKTVGNTVAGLDLVDTMMAIQGRKGEPDRPKIWPLGHP